MGKKKLKRKLARVGLLYAGLLARATGQEYHTDSPEDEPVYHNRRQCPEGLKIEPEHLWAGRGNRKDLCRACRTLPATI